MPWSSSCFYWLVADVAGLLKLSDQGFEIREVCVSFKQDRIEVRPRDAGAWVVVSATKFFVVSIPGLGQAV